MTERNRPRAVLRAALVALLLPSTGCVTDMLLKSRGDSAMRQRDHAQALANYEELQQRRPGRANAALAKSAAIALAGEYAREARSHLEAGEPDLAIAVLQGVLQTPWSWPARETLAPVLREAHVALLHRTIAQAREARTVESEPWTALTLLSRARRPLPLNGVSLEVPPELLPHIDAAALPLHEAVERMFERELAAGHPQRALHRAEPLLAWNDRPTHAAFRERLDGVRRDLARTHLARMHALQGSNHHVAALLHARLALDYARQDVPARVHTAWKPRLDVSFAPGGDCEAFRKDLAQQGWDGSVGFPVEVVIEDCTTDIKRLVTERYEKGLVTRQRETTVWVPGGSVKAKETYVTEEDERVIDVRLRANQVLKLRYTVRGSAGHTRGGLVEVQKTLERPERSDARQQLRLEARSEIVKQAAAGLRQQIPQAWAALLVAEARRAEAAGDRDAAEQALARAYLVGVTTEAAEAHFERVYGVPRWRLPFLLSHQKHSPGDWEAPLPLPDARPARTLPAPEVEWKEPGSPDVVLSYGYSLHTGLHGVGVGWFSGRRNEDDVGGALLAGVGPHALTLGLGLRYRAGYLDGHVGWAGQDGLTKLPSGGFGYGVTGGIELRPAPWLQLKGGLGWASDAFGALQPRLKNIVVEGSAGLVF